MIFEIRIEYLDVTAESTSSPNATLPLPWPSASCRLSPKNCSGPTTRSGGCMLNEHQRRNIG